MDNRDFDKIFKDGLEETRSFDQAEESWQKLHPRLHPPKKRRRLVIWPFLAAAVVVLGLTTFWFYNQSASLQEDVAELNQQLKQKEQQAPADIKIDDTAMSDNDTEIESAQDAININSSKSSNINNLESSIAGDSDTEGELLNIKKPKSPGIRIQDSNTPQIHDNSKPIDFLKSQEAIVNMDAGIEEAIQSENSSNELQKESQKSSDINFIASLKELINKNWLLDYNREDPELALLEHPKEDREEDQDKKSDSRWSVGANAGIAWDNSISSLFANDAEALSYDRGSPKLTFYQYGVHGNYDLNKNWQLHGSVNRERVSSFYPNTVFVPSAEYFDVLNANVTPGFGNDDEAISEYLSSNYNQTEIIQKNWLLNTGIRRRLFSIKKLNAFMGAYATTRFFQKQAVSYSVRSQNNTPSGDATNLKATVTNKTDFAISPSFGIGSPIGQSFYWTLEAKYDFHLSNDVEFELPELGIMLGAGYKF